MDVGEKELLLKSRLKVCTCGPRVPSSANGSRQLADMIQKEPHSKEDTSDDQLTEPPSA